MTPVYLTSLPITNEFNSCGHGNLCGCCTSINPPVILDSHVPRTQYSMRSAIYYVCVCACMFTFQHSNPYYDQQIT